MINSHFSGVANLTRSNPLTLIVISRPIILNLAYIFTYLGLLSVRYVIRFFLIRSKLKYN